MGPRWALRGFTDRLDDKESIKDSSQFSTLITVNGDITYYSGLGRDYLRKISVLRRKIKCSNLKNFVL